jgi:hypothetical protein
MRCSLIIGNAYFSEGDTRGQVVVGIYAQVWFSRLRSAARSGCARVFARTVIASGGPSRNHRLVYRPVRALRKNSVGAVSDRDFGLALHNLLRTNTQSASETPPTMSFCAKPAS